MQLGSCNQLLLLLYYMLEFTSFSALQFINEQHDINWNKQDLMIFYGIESSHPVWTYWRSVVAGIENREEYLEPKFAYSIVSTCLEESPQNH